MIRSLLALLLALSLWPSLAAASPGAPVPERAEEIRSAPAEVAQNLLRSSTGFELVRGLAPHCPGGCTHGSGRAPAGPPPLPGLDRLAVVHPLSLRAPRVQDVDRAMRPLSERLPYFATAPPSQR